MTTGDLSSPDFSGDYRNNRQSMPKVSLFTMLRLGLVQVGLGMMSVMILGVLNRILIKELGVPGTIATIMLAMTLFVAPARIIVGQLSDTKPLFGYHRTGYIWVGAVSLVASVSIAIQVMWQFGASLKQVGWALPTYGWGGLLALMFGLYGLSVSLLSTPFATLLVDITDEDDRSRVVAIDWSMLLGGTIVGAITIASLLKSLANNATISQVQMQIDRLFLVVPASVIVLAVIGTWGVERKYSRYGARLGNSQGNENLSLNRALGILTANPQTRLFFTFLMAMTLGLFLQDPILETYGGEVFDLSVGQTAQLNAFFGVGTLIGLSAAGFALVPRLGKQKTARLGCLLVAGSLLFVFASGFTQNPAFLYWALVLFGIGAGILTTGAVTLMLDLTVPETAGTFIGAWGLSQALARGIAVVSGGTLLDISKSFVPKNTILDISKSFVPNNTIVAYGMVFCLQSLAMIVAVHLLDRVNIREFKTNAKDAVMATIAADGD